MKKKGNRYLIVSMTLIVLMAFIYLAMDHTEDILPEAKDVQQVEISQVELLQQGGATMISLPEFLDVQGELWLRATLNYSFEGANTPSLILQANHTFMDFYLNGEPIYSVPEQDHSLGNYFTHIPLPTQIEDGVLEIRITVPEKGIKRIQVPALFIGDEAAYLKSMICHDIPSLLLNIFILFCGVVMMMMLLLAEHQREGRLGVLLKGSMAINCALYFMCETCCVVYLAKIPALVYFMDMVSFAMIAPLLLTLVGWEQEGWPRKLLCVAAAPCFANVVVQLALALSGVAELRSMLIVTQIFQVMGILAVLISIAYCVANKKRVRVLYSAAFMAVCGAVDLVLFWLELSQNNMFFMKIGILLYLLQQMYGYIRQLVEQSARKTREVYYKALAMQDAMTQCYSRAAYEIDKAEWGRQGCRTVFSMDLNNLKQTNDLYGHSEGDRLINAFGDILRHVFQAWGKCYRVGGDEFWAFCDDLPAGQAQRMQQQAFEAAKKYNETGSLAVKLTFAIGVAHTQETKGDLDKALELADERMYENKRSMKQVEEQH